LNALGYLNMYSIRSL